MNMQEALSPELSDALLARLSNDEDFRAVFKLSPRIALEALGHPGAVAAGQTIGKGGDEPSGVWGCMAVSKLASPAQIAASREEIQGILTQPLSNVVHKLDVNA